MFKQSKPLFFVCETPLHAGSGSDLGIVDLPIQRERHTSFPKIEGSSFKGAVREAVEKRVSINKDTNTVEFNEVSFRNSLSSVVPNIGKEWKMKKEVKLINYNQAIDLTFGPEEGDGHAGALGFSDARLLLFPVKSVKGVFAWVTCPKVLEQFKRDMSLSGITIAITGSEPTANNCVAKSTNTLKVGSSNKIVLEEYAFTISGSYNVEVGGKDLGTWLSELMTDGFWKDKIKNDIVILSNDDFKDFVNLSTEVITRTKINNETGTVQPGALFTEEFLPAESIMYSLIMASPVFLKEKDKVNAILQSDVDVMNYFQTALPEVIQIGGNATLGKGIVRMYKSLLTQEIKKEVTNG
jgi:CRISPR-associated protein Cmr4